MKTFFKNKFYLPFAIFLLSAKGHTPEKFATVRDGLKEVLQLSLIDELTYPDSGICRNAGFLGKYPLQCETPIDRSLGFDTFLQMCRIYKKVKGIKIPGATFSYPFGSAALYEYKYKAWKDEQKKLRIDAMRWIIEQIEKYKLHM